MNATRKIFHTPPPSDRTEQLERKLDFSSLFKQSRTPVQTPVVCPLLHLLVILSLSHLILSTCVNSFPGVYKGLQHSSTSASVLTSPSSVTMTSAPASLPASNSTNSSTTSIHNTHNPLSSHGNSTANSAPQLLIGNNLCLSVATPQIASLNSRHLPRSLGGVPPAALKLAAAASNCQLPKVTTG